MALHQPGIEPGSVPWQGTILPLDHWCCVNKFHIDVDFSKTCDTLQHFSQLAESLLLINYTIFSGKKLSQQIKRGIPSEGDTPVRKVNHNRTNIETSVFFNYFVGAALRSEHAKKNVEQHTLGMNDEVWDQTASSSENKEMWSTRWQGDGLKEKKSWIQEWNDISYEIVNYKITWLCRFLHFRNLHTLIELSFCDSNWIYVKSLLCLMLNLSTNGSSAVNFLSTYDMDHS